MKVLICGSRDWQDRDAIAARVSQLPESAIVIQGGARGADYFAACAAIDRGLHVATVNADWEREPKRAGHLRNAAMLELGPDLVIAFSSWTPPTPGTASMIQKARAAGVPVELHMPYPTNSGLTIAGVEQIGFNGFAKSGMPITPELVEQLALEAEEGYDLPPRPGPERLDDISFP